MIDEKMGADLRSRMDVAERWMEMLSRPGEASEDFFLAQEPVDDGQGGLVVDAVGLVALMPSTFLVMRDWPTPSANESPSLVSLSPWVNQDHMAPGFMNFAEPVRSESRFNGGSRETSPAKVPCRRNR